MPLSDFRRGGHKGRVLYAIDASDAQLVRWQGFSRQARKGAGLQEEADRGRGAGAERLFADEAQRIDLSAVAQNLEVDVGTGRVASGPHQCDGFATLHRVPDLHQGPLVVGIAGDVSVPVIDLHEVAVAGTLT